MTIAVFEEVSHVSDETADHLLAALNHFIQAPLKQKHRRRWVYQAIQLVGDA
jgi:hypothetical protein